MDRERKLPPVEEPPPETPDEAEGDAHAPSPGPSSTEGTGNPARTTSGKITSPKFGSAGSGGLEFEPGPERD
ncbi:MAG TPA: hypothetical protein VGH98_14120 [Gemmatimonadaceae bacterium]|jgi:hypothetical protein